MGDGPDTHHWGPLASAARDTAAALLLAGGEVGERTHLQPQARKAVSALDGWLCDAAESSPRTAAWCHQPGGLDLVAHDPRGGRWIGELKLRKTDELLWDLLKLVDSARQPDVLGAFLVVGARCDEADSQERCRELVTGEMTRHPILDLFSANREPWTWLLEGGTARPTQIPGHLNVHRRTAGPINLDGHESELVLLSVEGDWSEPIDFDSEWWCGDWPVGIAPTQRYASWRLRQCEFLRELDAVGELHEEAARGLAKEKFRLSLDRDTALNHRCSRLVSPGAPRTPTDAGRIFLARWLEPLREACQGRSG